MGHKEEFYDQNPNADCSIQWAVDLLDQYHRPLREGFNSGGQAVFKKEKKYLHSNDEKKVDKDIMLCPNCSSCWEYGKTPGEKEYYIYADFPRIGKKEHSICPECSDWLFNR